jgi:hypothetical protein
MARMLLDARAMRDSLGPLLWLLLTVGLTGAGCQPAIPGGVSGIPPRSAAIPRPPASVVFTDVVLPLDQAVRAIEAAIPAGLTGETGRRLGGLGNLSVRWQVRRGPPRLRVENGGLTLQMSLHGDVVIELWPLRCTSPGFGFTVDLAARPALDQMGQLTLQNVRARRQFNGEVRCAGQRVPLERLLDAGLQHALTGVERALAAVRVPLGPVLEGGLALLGEPQDLKVAGRELCLDLAPGGLVVAPLTSAAGLPVARVGVEVAPRVELGSCQSRKRGGNRGRKSAGLTVRTLELGPAFQAQVMVAVGHAELAAPLRAAAVGQVWGPPGRQLRIHGLDVRDAAGQVLVSLQVTGALDGTLHLWGTPTVRWETRKTAGGPPAERLILEVPDLRAALQTESLLTRFKLGLLALTGEGLGDKLRAGLRIDLTDRFAEVQRAVEQRLIRPAGAWKLEVSTALLGRPVPQVVSAPGELLIVATVGGQARLGPP